MTSSLGDPVCKPLTVSQFRELTRRMRAAERPGEDRELKREDLLRIGCGEALAERILCLLSRGAQLDAYLRRGEKHGCLPLSRINDAYPMVLRKKLGLEAPGVLWYKGDPGLLQRPMIALVGSRDPAPENAVFAAEVGIQAARQGYVLVSGNARGCDRIAQEQCLQEGGCVVSVVADELEKAVPGKRILYLSENDFDLPFSAHRALQRNHVIHCLGEKVFVAGARLGKGGTWSGTWHNLRNGRTPVFCFSDGSAAARELEQLGAVLIRNRQLQDIPGLQSPEQSFF